MLSSVVFFLTLMVGSSQPVSSQQVIANPLHAFAINRDKVLQIEGHLVAAFDAGIEVYDNYTGHVTARLGDVVIRARLLKIQKAQPGHSADLKISGDGDVVSHAQSLEAAGDVVITYGDLTAVGERLVFDMRQDTAMLAGDIVVWLGQHVMRGGRLTTSMATGASRIDGIRAALGDRVPVNPALSERIAELVPDP
jgi:lipopolysaccharide export system protein LptA